MTSESSGVNIISSINVTAAETGTVRVSLATPTIVLVRVPFLLIVAMINLCGNGFTLVTIRMTPRLWTKTNIILASMLLSAVMTGVCMLWYTPYLLVVFVFKRPCQYALVTAALRPLLKMCAYVSTYHVITVSVERYVAIVYPLHYETTFTNCTLKWAISVTWAMGIFIGMTHWLWLINANRTKCDVVPAKYYLVEILLVYTPVCICLFICYGKILVIWWRQRQRIESQPGNANPASGPSLRITTFTISAFGSSPSQTRTAAAVPAMHIKTSTGENAEDLSEKPLTSIGSLSEPIVASGAASSEMMQEQHRQKLKCQRREFKAVYLTSAIVGTFVILRLPYVLGRILELAGCDPVVVSYLSAFGGALSIAVTWAVYAAVSKSYRRAYRQMLIRIGCCCCCKNVTPPADNSLVV